MAAHGVVLPFVSLSESVSTWIMDRSWAEGESEYCKGQNRLCLDKWLKSLLLRAGHCFGEVTALGFWSDQGREKEIVQMFPQVLFTMAACCTGANLQSCKEKKDPKINNRTYVFFPFPLCIPMFSKSKVSVMLYRKAKRTLRGDRKFPQYEWSVLIRIHLSVCEVQMIWQKV